MNGTEQNKLPQHVYDLNFYEMMYKLIDYALLNLFVQEMIDYSLLENNLNWEPPMNLQFLRLQHASKRYFDNRIGKAVGHICVERNGIKAALKLGFDEDFWFTLNPGDARERLAGFLGLMLTNPKVPMNLAAFQMFSFGCYIGRATIKRQQYLLTIEVVQALVRTCCLHFPYSKQYVNFSNEAKTYNSEHRCMHTSSDGLAKQK